MGREIERKFLVRDEGWRAGAVGERIEQGFLSTDPRRVVRVRVQGGRTATVAIKGAALGATRPEFEYAIPLDDARELLAGLCLRPPIEKTRYRVDVAGAWFEVDVFEGANAGLVLAEIELSSEDEPFPRPDWLGEEVTHDPRYSNASLAERPYGSWDPGISIDALRADEWRLLKELRIRALADAPDAFGPTVEAARAEPDAYWQRGAATFAEPGRTLLVARQEGRPIGLVSAVADPERTGHLGAMWLEPGARGAGLGGRLFDAACERLRAGGCRRVRLWVTETNERAIALYRARGFAPTGTARPLREGSPLRELEMERALPA
jgi:adenylate cyclase